MSLTLALNTALSGLNVNQQALSVLSQNIANANTQGYSNQVMNQQAISIEGQDDGVSIGTVTRQVNAYLTQAVQNQTSAVGQATVVNNYNTQIQQLMGQPGSSNSIDTFVNSFFNDVQQLADTPDSASLQQTAVDSGVTLATQLNQTAQGLQKLQYQADQDIGTAVAAINTDLTNLSQVNAQIVNLTAQGKSVADLQDQRDSLINDVAQYMNIQTYTNANGSITVSTGTGSPLVEGEDTYQLNYSTASSAASFDNGTALSALTLIGKDGNGNVIGNPVILATGGPPSQVTTSISSGQLAGLFSMRDSQIPAIQSQLDTLTSNLRDQVNAIQNSGSSSPGVNSYTGQRAVNAGDYSQWSGQVQIAVLGADGQPLSQPYATGATQVPPLDLDLSTLNTGNGAGNPSVQGIINEINQYYGPPQNKAQVSNLDNIQLASDSSTLNSNPPQFNFDLNLSNLSSTSSNVYVTGMSVVDSGGTSMGSVTSTAPSVALNPASTYVTTAGSGAVTVNTTGTNNLTNGETVYLSTPSGAVDGIPAADMGGFFTISNVTANSFQITAANGATAATGTTTAMAGQTALPPYSTVAAGDTSRTTSDGTFTADLSANPTSPYYTVTATVAVDNGSGNPPIMTQITYQVTNQPGNMLNNLYGAQTVSGTGTLAKPTSTQPLATAILVDANGNELPKVNGQYVTNENGYLEIKAGNSTNTIAINSLDSAEEGKPNDTPPQPGTNQGFSQYFGLNNFFAPNDLTPTGDTVAGSALNLQVNQNLQDNPNLISTGQLTPSEPAAGSSTSYTFERDAGDNSVIQKMATLGTNNVIFAATGGLGQSTQTFDAYAGEIVGAAASRASTATANQTNAQTLLTGYTQQVSTVSGVNMNTELANTVIYQNAYAASARVITVTGDLFNTLLQSFGT